VHYTASIKNQKFSINPGSRFSYLIYFSGSKNDRAAKQPQKRSGGGLVKGGKTTKGQLRGPAVAA
jgi:hypothetical protein